MCRESLVARRCLPDVLFGIREDKSAPDRLDPIASIAYPKTECGRCVMVKTSVFQTEDEGSIPSARSNFPPVPGEQLPYKILIKLS